MARWNINSVLRGIYFYTFAIAALIYVVCTALFKNLVWWVYRRQAQRRNWHGLADLPPYKHQRIAERDVSKQLVRSNTEELLSSKSQQIVFSYHIRMMLNHNAGS